MTPNAVRFTNPAELARPPGYSNVVEVLRGRTVYIAGQIAVDKNGQLVGKGDSKHKRIKRLEMLVLRCALWAVRPKTL